jgi:hypothetical protein
MADYKVVERIDAPIAKVWSVVSDFGDVSYVGDAVKECTIDGEGLGCVRTIEMAAGGLVEERLDAYNDDGCRFAYSIVNDASCPLPFEGYSSRFSLRPLGPSATELEWHGDFQPKGDASEEDATNVVSAIYAGGISGIKAALGL